VDRYVGGIFAFALVATAFRPARPLGGRCALKHLLLPTDLRPDSSYFTIAVLVGVLAEKEVIPEVREILIEL
jgi:hypothetical protein